MVRPKKHFGQHFLKDQNIARKIVASLNTGLYDYLIEVGPGTGFLTDFLLNLPVELILIEKDPEAFEFLKKKYAHSNIQMLHADFLQTDLNALISGKPVGIVGNFPYNISTQIVFKILENKALIPEMTGMFQWEVAERIASVHGNKNYGILSVLVQVYYHVEILFTVPPGVFFPPPKVKSAVIRLERKDKWPEIDFNKFKTLVKTAFNQRRKTLRNSLKSLNLPSNRLGEDFSSKRPEELTPREFVKLFKLVEDYVE